MKKIQHHEILQRLRALLTQPERLEDEWRKTRSIDYHRPLEAMKHRIRHAGGDADKAQEVAMAPASSRNRLRWLSAAASVLVILSLGAAYYYNRSMRQAQTTELADNRQVITHGTMRATLKMADGRTIELGSDERRNKQLMAEAQTESQGETQAQEVKMLRIETPRGGEFHITLGDGSKVWLNAESSLEYPEQFSNDERRVKVSGEAYLQVAHNDKQPFLVETGQQVVRVLGTQFNINAYPENDGIYTTLVEGSISLYNKGNEADAVTLKPGDQAMFDTQQGRANVRRVDAETMTAWRKGKFVFENQSLDQIMHTLSRWYDFDYRFTSNDLRRTEFMGTMPRYGDFNDVLQILSLTGNVNFRQQGKTIVITRKRQ